jgi:hypothetical protein
MSKRKIDDLFPPGYLLARKILQLHFNTFHTCMEYARIAQTVEPNLFETYKSISSSTGQQLDVAWMHFIFNDVCTSGRRNIWNSELAKEGLMIEKNGSQYRLVSPHKFVYIKFIMY